MLSSQSLLTPSRVKKAVEEKKEIVSNYLSTQKLTINNFNLLIIAYKQEKELQIFVKHKDSSNYKYLLTYEICSSSGVLGPKRKEGDLQVPEGFYYISHFNPYSNFYLSLKVSYPNASDKILSDKIHPGGDIYIHGSCVTIGCIPITDEKIKELYLFAAYSSVNGQKQIPVYIFPFKMTDKNMNIFSKQNENLKNINFWTNLKQGYDLFVNNKKELKFDVDKNGQYIFKTK